MQVANRAEFLGSGLLQHNCKASTDQFIGVFAQNRPEVSIFPAWLIGLGMWNSPTPTGEKAETLETQHQPTQVYLSGVNPQAKLQAYHTQCHKHGEARHGEEGRADPGSEPAPVWA